jgi:hypothetical protein
MDVVALEQEFASGEAVPLEPGRWDGAFLVAPGTVLSRPAAAAIWLMLWRAKVVHVSGTSLVNVVTPLELQAAAASLQAGRSRLDGRPCVVVDYSASPFLPARVIRDELRRVDDRRYLGCMWVAGRRLAPLLCWFTLTRRHERQDPPR